MIRRCCASPGHGLKTLDAVVRHAGRTREIRPSLREFEALLGRESEWVAKPDLSRMQFILENHYVRQSQNPNAAPQTHQQRRNRRSQRRAPSARPSPNCRSRYPGIKERLLDENGAVRRFVNVYVNEEDIRFLQNQETPVKSGDEISIIPAIAGG